MKTYCLLLISILFIGCNNYENKKVYDIKVNETFEIYYSSNNTSYFTIQNENLLKNVVLISHKKVDNLNNKCEGCSSNFAFTFKGIKKGKEIISIKETSIGIEKASEIKNYNIIIE